MVVSVMRSFFCEFIHFTTPSGPSASKSCLVPLSELSSAGFILGNTGILNSGLMPLLSFTYFSPRKLSTLSSLSSLTDMLSRLGLSAIKPVSHIPALNVGWLSTFKRNALLVLTPLTFISFKALLALFTASLKVLAHAVTLTSRLS